MPWIERPTDGFIAGTVTDATGRAVEAAILQIRRTGWFRRTRRTTTDANGWFGLTRLKPGTYRVRLNDRTGQAACGQGVVDVKAGAVARIACQVSGRGNGTERP
jgi:protocatechuate 3,4-dioxygenase beta subunit